MELLMATQFTLEAREDDSDFYVELQISGDGDLEHYVDAFKAFLIAAGYHPQTVDEELEEINREMNADMNPHEELFGDPQGRESRW